MEAILLKLLEIALPTIATILCLVLVAIAKKVLSKLGLDENKQIDEAIDRYVHIGVNAIEKKAESAVQNKLAAMTPNEKLNAATATILHELEQAGVKDVTPQLIQARIESYLNTTK